MPIEMSSNTGGKPIEFDVVVEKDDGDIFLAVTGDIDQDTEQTVFDYFTTDPDSIESFFDMVSGARDDWNRLASEEDEAAGDTGESNE